MYLKLKISVAAGLLFVLASFNYLIDPYGIYLPQQHFSFNQNKPQFFMKEPIIKPYRVSDLAPDTVILGLSQAGLGYDESHPAFDGQSVYNFSMAGASMYLVNRSFQHALAQGNLQRVILDLSVLSFNEYHDLAARNQSSEGLLFENLLAVDENGNRNWLVSLRHIALATRFLLSWSATIDSWATLRKQGPYDGWHLNALGGWRGSTLAPGQSQGRRFMAIERRLFGDFFKEMSKSRQFSIYTSTGAPSSAFDHFRRLLMEAQENNLAVTLIMPPSHAYFLEAVHYQGLMPQLNDWKRQLVQINEQVAADLGKPPYPLWDFANYSTPNTEPVPAGKDKTTRMKWHFDPIHFTKASGDNVLNQIYLEQPGPGVLLNSSNFESIQAQQQAGRMQYHQENPEIIDQLKKLFRKVAGREAE